MLESCHTALSHIEGRTSDEFLRDVKTQDAVLWRLAVIGEAANHLTPATRDAIDVPWSQIIGMRHIAIHHYRKLDMGRVWAAVADRVPELFAKLDAYMREIP